MRNISPEIANFIETTNVPGVDLYLWGKLNDRAEMVAGFTHPYFIKKADDALSSSYQKIKSDPLAWSAANISIPITQSLRDSVASGAKWPDRAFIPWTYGTMQQEDISKDVGLEQVGYLVQNNVDLNQLPSDVKPLAFKYKLTKQILDQNLTGKWTGTGYGSPKSNALAMADVLMGAGINDIRQFGPLPDGGYGNKETGQAINPNYDRAGGQIFSGTYTGKDSTGFGVQFGPDGTPYFYTQQGASTSSMGEVMPIISLGLTFFAPGIGTAIGTALGATGTAAAVLGSAIVQGTLSELSGGDFLEGAIKGAVTAGVAPAVANTVGSAVADVMADSAVKNVITNAVASSASSAVTAALTGGDVGNAALVGALAGAGGSVGRELGIASEYGTTPFSEQTQLLAGQEAGLGGAGSIGSSLGQAAGAIAGGADSTQAIISAISKTAAEDRASTPTSGSSTTAETPVSPLPGAEITTAPPPETGQITDMGVMDGVAGTIPEITPPSTQEIPIPDQISQELGGIQEGIAETIPSLDQDIIDLITQPETLPYDPNTVTQLPEIVVTGSREEPIPGIQEGMAEGIPDLSEPEFPPYDPNTVTMLEEVVITTPREVQIPGIQEGMAGTIPEPEIGQSPTPIQAPDEINYIPEEVPFFEPGVSEPPPPPLPPEIDTGVQEGIVETIPEITEEEPTPYIRDTYISGGRRQQPTFGPTVTTLGQALAAPLFPSAPVSGLTSYRGAGEIEGQKTGKPRKNVWNEASLRLKDALGL
jgi:hypothetical protein